MSAAESNVIHTQDLWRTYQMGAEEIHALRGVSFDVGPNEYLAVMGPSGSGKSTLMNLIGCLDTPSRGEYYLRGKLVSQMNDDELAAVRNREIGFVFQTFNLLPRASALHNVELPLVYAGIPREERLEKLGFVFQGFHLLTRMTALENVMMPMVYAGVPRGERKRLAEAALRDVGLGERAKHKPSDLSGGQQQRVAIARALVNRPPILLADEPTGALDTKTGHDILVLFKQLQMAGHTIILITHDPEVADSADRALHIRDGQLVEEAHA